MVPTVEGVYDAVLESRPMLLDVPDRRNVLIVDILCILSLCVQAQLGRVGDTESVLLEEFAFSVPAVQKHGQSYQSTHPPIHPIMHALFNPSTKQPTNQPVCMIGELMCPRTRFLCDGEVVFEMTQLHFLAAELGASVI